LGKSFFRFGAPTATLITLTVARLWAVSLALIAWQRIVKCPLGNLHKTVFILQEIHFVLCHLRPLSFVLSLLLLLAVAQRRGSKETDLLFMLIGSPLW